MALSVVAHCIRRPEPDVEREAVPPVPFAIRVCLLVACRAPPLKEGHSVVAIGISLVAYLGLVVSKTDLPNYIGRRRPIKEYYAYYMGSCVYHYWVCKDSYRLP